MKVTVSLTNGNYADGAYAVNASGYDLATLYWADDNGILDDHTAFAVIPLSDGHGEFRLSATVPYLYKQQISLQELTIKIRVIPKKCEPKFRIFKRRIWVTAYTEYLF